MPAPQQPVQPNPPAQTPGNHIPPPLPRATTLVPLKLLSGICPWGNFYGKMRAPPQPQYEMGWKNDQGREYYNGWSNESSNGWGETNMHDLLQTIPQIITGKTTRPLPLSNDLKMAAGHAVLLGTTQALNPPRTTSNTSTHIESAKSLRDTNPQSTQLRQNNMPYFGMVEGEFTRICVSAAQTQPSPNPNFKISHNPKERRIFPMS